MFFAQDSDFILMVYNSHIETDTADIILNSSMCLQSII